MGKKKSLRSKAVHFVADLTTGLLNPISDKTSTPSHPPHENVNISKTNQSETESISKEDDRDLIDGPDTSSFTAFLYSLLSSSESGHNLNQDEQNDNQEEAGDSSDNRMKENGRRKNLLSRGKQSLRALYQATRVFENKNQDKGDGSDVKSDNEAKFDGLEMRHIQNVKEPLAQGGLPETSEPSLLLTEKTRNALYESLPAIVHGRKWLLLYSTWRHGISLSTLYRRSMLWPGLSLLVVGDRKGAVFGGLVEAPLKPTNKKYQGTNSTFVFTNRPGDTVIFRPTGANRYFTLCSTEFIAVGGGGHFALYLDSDLLNGSSLFSETYGNPCLAFSEDFEVKEIELWGFVYGSKYEEILALSKTEMPGICRW
ncbi:TLD-domain containing nucleolar protein isoform 2 [Hibiscus syriacus]|uniref:Oxidation resistance protein 1 n=1 Tax=Hibiscus syriacus TaxID=106335 RepID=A0A6A2YD90_HIBSY|nr:oxidation resistance protein 1-like [Hibiscus syriacus]KAE8676576.1 TLD-domain containing nucleolar protein isoform 2 [Hibiscus syriacus]